MFEKEAEEYLDTESKYLIEDNEGNIINIAKKVKQSFKDGAEFGYNKAKEEMVQNGLALQSDMDKTIEQNIALKKELNKANEWHYVKDGDLPDEDVYVYLLFRGQEYPIVARRHLFKEWGRLKWCWDCKWGSGYTIEADNDKIIAWKEIVLPELKESE